MPLNRDYAVPTAIEVAAWVADTYELADARSSELCRDDYPLLFRISSPSGAHWLRIHTANHRSVARLEAQAQTISWLHRWSVRVVSPVEGRNRRFVQSLDVVDEHRSAILFTHAPGRPVNRTSHDEVTAFGAALGHLHGVPLPEDMAGLGIIDFDYLAGDPLDRLAQFPTGRAILGDARAYALGMGQRLTGLLDPAVPLGLCHGDVHPGNGHIDEKGNVTLLDFDELATGPLAYDLACYWRKCVLAHERQEDAVAEWNAFLVGYESVRRVSEAERDAIVPLATLRAIWTMALPAAYLGIWGDDWLSDPTYLSAHLDMIRHLAATTLAVR